MVKWGLPQGSKDIGDLTLLQDETTVGIPISCAQTHPGSPTCLTFTCSNTKQWEVFLRRAGLNPFAAQLILSSLRDPYDITLETSPLGATLGGHPTVVRVFSLSSFLLLSAEERISQFQALVGGSRILRRVNEVLDQKWPSAVNGFNM